MIYTLHIYGSEELSEVISTDISQETVQSVWDAYRNCDSLISFAEFCDRSCLPIKVLDNRQIIQS